MSLETLDRAVLLTHAVAGVITLTSGVAAMMTHKGGKAHRRWGLAFFWAMFVIFITSLSTIFLFRFNPLLLGLSILSFYMTFTGYRVTYRKRGAKGQNAGWVDWLAILFATVVGLFLAIWGGMVISGAIITWSSVFGILGVVAGLIILYTALWEDARGFRRPVEDRQWWWYYHMNRMLSGMIGAVTAFLVQQLGDAPFLGEFAWIVWVVPSVIGGVGAQYWVSAYRRKFNKRAMKT